MFTALYYSRPVHIYSVVDSFCVVSTRRTALQTLFFGLLQLVTVHDTRARLILTKKTTSVEYNICSVRNKVPKLVSHFLENQTF